MTWKRMRLKDESGAAYYGHTDSVRIVRFYKTLPRSNERLYIYLKIAIIAIIRQLFL